MNREVHVRFWEGLVVRSRWATQLSRFYIYIVSIFSLEGGLDGFPMRLSNEALPPSRYITLGEWPRLPSTARVERAHPDRARSASKEGAWPPPLIPFQSSSQKLPRRSHMLLDIRPQMLRPCLPIIPRVADAVGAEDEFV
jgi:hypothetical protein